MHYDYAAASVNGFLILVIASVIIAAMVHLYSFLHRKSPVCPAKLFLKSSKLQILASDTCVINITPDDPDFLLIVQNLEDDFYESKESFSVPILLIIRGKKYSIEVSDVGWNFKGEAHNCRKIKDPIALGVLLNSRIEKILKK
jgi:hypothetical protein